MSKGGNFYYTVSSLLTLITIILTIIYDDSTITPSKNNRPFGRNLLFYISF